MIGTIWQAVLVTPIFNALVALYQVTGSLGIAIIFLTVIMRALLIPAVLPTIKNVKKQRDLQPELERIKKKYKYDKRKQAEMQMELLKKHGLNPASGCLTQVLMIVVLIALYGVIRRFSTGLNLEEINSILYFNSLKFISLDAIKTNFLYLDLGKPDPYYVLAVLSGLLQLVSSKMLFPYSEEGEKAAKKTPDKADDIAYNMQSQMLYMMPIMNVIIGIKLPAGVMLYLVTTTLFSIAQTYFVNGLGGLKSWVCIVKKWIK